MLRAVVKFHCGEQAKISENRYNRKETPELND
jgi:hypothetical protein